MFEGLDGEKISVDMCTMQFETLTPDLAPGAALAMHLAGA